MREEQRKTLIEYGLLAYGTSWGLVAAYLLTRWLTGSWSGVFTYGHPVHWLAGYSALFASLLVVFRRTDIEGVRLWLKLRLSLHRVDLAILSILAIPVLSLMITVILGVPVDTNTWWSFLWLSLILMLAFSVPAEELGWRGLVTPIFLETMTVSSASVLTGLLVWLWRLPLYLLLLTANGVPLEWLSLIATLLLTLGNAYLATWLLRRQHGSVVYGMLLNWSSLVAIYALGIDVIVVAGATLFISALTALFLQGETLSGAQSVAADNALPLPVPATESPLVLKLGRLAAGIFIFLAVALAVALIAAVRYVSVYLIGIPLPAPFSDLLAYAGHQLVALTYIVVVLMVAIALIASGITLVISRALGKAVFLQKRVAILETKVMQLEAKLPQRQPEIGQDAAQETTS